MIAKDVVTQKFTGGQIAWNKTKNTFTTQPPNLASALSGLQIPGQKTPANSASPQAGVSWLSAHWLWLLAGAAALLLLILLALVARWWRRRRAAKRDAGSDDVSDSDDSGYEAVTESVSQWSPDADSDLATSSLSPEFRLRPRTVRLPSQSSARGCHRAAKVWSTSCWQRTKPTVLKSFPNSTTSVMTKIPIMTTRRRRARCRRALRRGSRRRRHRPDRDSDGGGRCSRRTARGRGR